MRTLMFLFVNVAFNEHVSLRSRSFFLVFSLKISVQFISCVAGL